MDTRIASLLALTLLGSGCAPLDLDKTSESDQLDIDPDDVRADSLLNPLDHGELSFEAPNAAQIGPQRYHAWQFTLTGEANLELRTAAADAAGPEVDTVLALYRRRADGRWGAAIARNDDDGGRLWSRVALLASDGEYRVIVRGYARSTTGPFAVLGACAGEGCPSAEPEPVAGCHPRIADAIRACHAGWLADPEFDPSSTSSVELMRQCADAEVVAPAWDALCLSPTAPRAICGDSLESFSGGHLALCRHELVGELLDATCVFGARYRDAFGTDVPLVVRWQRELRAGAVLEDLEASQIVRAVRETAYSDVTSVAEAFAAVDEGVVNQAALWDASNRREYVVYEVGAGDNSFGAFFAAGSVEPAARIVDGDISGCSATWGDERRSCSDAEPCASGLRCEGASEAPGRCVAPRADVDPAIGASCADDRACGSGLVCAGSALGEPGLCGPAWLRGRFATRPSQSIPDNARGGAAVQLLVGGLATVSTDVRIDLHVTHPRISDLRITLVNPAGTESVVFAGEGTGSEIYLRGVALRGFPGDEQVNGVWELRAVDTRRGSLGTIQEFGLELTSRWD